MSRKADLPSKMMSFRVNQDDIYLRSQLESGIKRPDGYVKQLVLLGLLAERAGFSVQGSLSMPSLAWPAGLMAGGVMTPSTPNIAPTPAPTPAPAVQTVRVAPVIPIPPLDPDGHDDGLASALDDPGFAASLKNLV